MNATAAGPPVIESYGDGGFRVSGTRYDGSLLVLPEGCVAWSAGRVEDISLEGLAALWPDGRPVAELLLLGTGKGPWPVPPVMRAALKERGLAVEPMDTGAACRTYNVLLGEHRRVAAALLAVG